jgi:glutathione peroxidase
MNRSFAALAAILALVSFAHAQEGKTVSPLDLKMTGIDGKELDLSKFKGKVVLIVNVASECGYTPQYEGLQKLYDKYGKDGFVVLGVPANEFGGQEPGSNDDIAKFCKTNYKVTFPMTAKVIAKGKGIAPLFARLTSKDTNPQFGGDIGWNFEKFLIGKSGMVIARFKSDAEPADIAADIEKALK